MREENEHVLILSGGDNISNRKDREWEIQSRLLLDVLGRMNMGACAVQSQDLFLGLEYLRELEAEHGLRFLCANLVDGEGTQLFPAHHVFEFGGKKLGVLAATDPNMQHAIRSMPQGLEFLDPGPALEAGVTALRETEGCDAVVLLYGGRRDQCLTNCKDLAGVDLIFFGNASISQRVPAETDAGTAVFSAGNRGKDFGEIVLTMKDDGGVELSPILIHELDKNYEDQPEILALVDAYKQEAAERKQRAELIQKIAREYSEGSVTDNFLGTETCANCHQAEYESFMATGHAAAMASLQAEYQEDNPDCVGCHVTGWQEPGGYGLSSRNRSMLQHVQCEACHGYGTAHDRGTRMSQADIEAGCVSCHDAKNSPNFEYASYWEKIKH